MRVPGRCTVVSGTKSNSKILQRQQFDCGGSKLLPQQQRRCIPLQHFHDGIVDCPDGSDEFCFPGYVKCGTYCVSLKYAAQCFINPRCDNTPTSPQFCDVIKKKLCSIEGTVPCKGYGECVMKKWIENGQTNCIDKSDQDLDYIAVFGIKRGTNRYQNLQFISNTSDNLNDMMISTQQFIPSWLQFVSPSASYHGLIDHTDHGSISMITNDWKNDNAITQSTTTQFIFQIPNNNNDNNDNSNKSSNDQHFKLSNFDPTIVGFINKSESNSNNFNFTQINHLMQKNLQNFTTGIDKNQTSTIRISNDNGDNKLGYNGILKQDNIIVSNNISSSSLSPSLSSSSLSSSSSPSLSSSLLPSLSPPLAPSLSSSLSSSLSPSSLPSNKITNQNNMFNSSIKTISNSVENRAIISKELEQMQSSNLSKQQREEQIISTSQNDDLANLITSTTTYHLSPDQIACARYEYAEAHRLVPEPLCTCPPGEMPGGNHSTCKATIISTFGIDVSNMCGGMETIPEERSRLAILVLNRTGLPYQACVRRDGHPVMVQLDCSQCTVKEFDDAFKQNSNDQYVPLRIMELSVGACLTSALNDCDPEHADCLMNGPRYECRCHDGWNDTSKNFGKAEGRRCEQLILLADGCILFYGYCLLWWLLLFGISFILLLLLLYWLGSKLYKLCKKRRRRNVIEEQGHLVTSEVSSIKNSNANDNKLAIIESINMNNNPNSIDTISVAADCDEKLATTTTTTTTTTATTIIDNKCITNSMQNDKQNATKNAEKILIKQESVKSLNLMEKNDEKQQTKVQSEKLEQTSDQLKSERVKIEQNEQKLSMNQHAKINSSILSKNKLMRKTLSDDQNESINESLETSKNATINQSQKFTELTQNYDDEKMLKNVETMEATNSKVMNISQSVSETSLRTMWELFKQGTWKQSSRPSSIKSSTSSLDHLIDVFLCRKRNKKIHPDTITISNDPEYPLNTIKISNSTNADTIPSISPLSHLSNSAFTTAITCCSINTATTTTITTATTTTTTNDSISCYYSTNNMEEQLFTATGKVPMQSQLLEQKIITETKTLTTKSTISLLPQELSLLSLKNTSSVQSMNPTPTTTTTIISDRLEFTKVDQQSILNDAKKDSIDNATTTINEMTQQCMIDRNQKLSVIEQNENKIKDEMDTKLSTTTIVTSSDKQLKQCTSSTEQSISSKTQSENDSCDMITMIKNDNDNDDDGDGDDNLNEKMLSTNDELRNTLKEVTSTKPPIKRLTEKQKEKLSASCGHLHIQSDDEMNRKGDGGSIRQFLATARNESRRKLSSISEKSTEMMNGGNQLISAPSSISCPTTTRRSKDYRQLPRTLQRHRDNAYGVWNYFFADLMASLTEEPTTNINDCAKTIPNNNGTTIRNASNWSKLEQNQINAKLKHKTGSNISQHSIAITDKQRPPWNFSPLKDGNLDRIAPLQPVFSHSNQPRKWLSALHLNDDKYATALQSSRRNISERRQSDCNLRDISHLRMTRGSHSARLHTRLTSAKMSRNISGVKWTPNDINNQPIKEQLWWGK